MATLRAGTSGFAYPSWKPGFYPERLPQTRFLEHYAHRLNAVEINYTFRRLPSAATLEKWAQATPAGFTFAVKAHQRITHFQRLSDAGDFTGTFLAALRPLRAVGKLGPLLFQLPPSFRRDDERLDGFLRLLRAGAADAGGAPAAAPEGAGTARPDRLVFEFRHASWLTDDVFTLLREHGVALCVTDSEGLAVPDVVSAAFVYYRLRRPDYGDDDLAGWGERARAHLAAGRDVYVMLKHEDDPRGALQAERLLTLA